MTAPEPRILLVANRTCPCPDVLDTVRGRAGGEGEIFIVAPALNSRLRHWVSDVDDAVAGARERLERSLAWLGEAGVHARGEVGDSDPLVAIEDALAGFAATELVISTYPPGQSNWLERDLPRRALESSGLPVVHLVSRYGLVGG
jgi:hypothetical protein